MKYISLSLTQILDVFEYCLFTKNWKLIAENIVAK